MISVCSVFLRIYENEAWNLNLNQAKEFTGADGTIDDEKYPLVYYDLFGLLFYIL